MTVEASVAVAYSDSVVDDEPDIDGELELVSFPELDTDGDTEDEAIGDKE